MALSRASVRRRRRATPREAEATAELQARYAEYRALPERRRTALELLGAASPDVAIAIRSEAAFFFGRTLGPEMPLYQQRLAQIAEKRLRGE